MDAPWVTTPAAAPALAFAAAGGDPLALSGALGSRFGLDAAQRAAVLTQIELRATAFSQVAVAVPPSGVVAPTPVITTVVMSVPSKSVGAANRRPRHQQHYISCLP